MLQALTRRIRNWLHGGEQPEAEAPVARCPQRGVPDAARRLYESGAALLREGKPADALELLDSAVAVHPEYAAAHEQAGVALLDLQRYEEAEDRFKLSLGFGPESGETCVHLAMACWNQGRTDAAIAHFRHALQVDPSLVDAHLFLAGLLYTEGKLEAAAECYVQALAQRPGIPELHLNHGLTLLKLGRPDAAAVELERALDLNPDFAEAHFNLGSARAAQQRDAEAIGCFERAIALKPDYAQAWTNLGGVFRVRGAIDKALEYYRHAHSLDPASVEINHNMGVAWHDLGRPDEAIAWYEEAQRIRPRHPESQLNLAVARLQTGDLARGWEAFECRFRQPTPGLGAQTRQFPYPRWAGEPLAGKRLLVWGEQGIGDEILYSAMYEEVAGAAQACVIECAPKLLAQFTRSFPGARVVPRSDPPHPDTAQPFDFQSPAGALACWLRPDISAFPARAGHLVADLARVAAWRERIAQLGDGLKVGFSWRSSNLKGERALACTRLDQWGAIFGVPGVRFVSLQYDECSEELARARERFGVELTAFPEVDLYNDLDEAAALTCALDLVISAPTAVSLHAAALGVPTWQMSYGADWQMHGTDRNLWFPSITTFKRAWNQEWEAVIAAIAARLRERVEGATHANQGSRRA